jgi:hypothetical protein
MLRAGISSEPNFPKMVHPPQHATQRMEYQNHFALRTKGTRIFDLASNSTVDRSADL